MTDPTGNGDGDWRFDDLRALYINSTLKRSPERSHTQGLIDSAARSWNATGSPSPRCGPSITTSPPAYGRT
jgi:hypothetical protein